MDKPLSPPIYVSLKPPMNAAEACLLGICLWVGAQSWIRILNNDLGSIDVLLGRGWAIGWAIGLSGGAGMALLGLLWRGKPIIAVALQEMGYTAFAAATVARCIALIALGQPDTLPYFAIFVAGTVGRVIQLEINLARHTGVKTSRLARLLRRPRAR